MKLSAYIKDINTETLSTEAFEEMMDELEAVGEARKALKRLVSLESLNADTSTAQYQLAMETILTPVGLDKNESISAEGLMSKIKVVAGRVWAQVLRGFATIANRWGKIYSRIKDILTSNTPHDSFLKDYKHFIRKGDPENHAAIVADLKVKLEKVVHVPHHNGYADKTAVKRLLVGDTQANLAFTTLKVTASGESKGSPNIGASIVVPHKLPGILKSLSSIAERAQVWVDDLKAASDAQGAEAKTSEDAGEDGGSGESSESEASKRLQAAIVAVKTDLDIVSGVITHVGSVMTTLNELYDKYGKGESAPVSS